MNTMRKKIQNRTRRHKRVRSQIKGTGIIPRLSVYRSNTRIYAQLIDDENGKTLASASDDVESKGTKTEHAKSTGLLLAELAKEKKIKKIVFDRGGRLYQGRVAAIAEGAREGGLQF